MPTIIPVAIIIGILIALGLVALSVMRSRPAQRHKALLKRLARTHGGKVRSGLAQTTPKLIMTEHGSTVEVSCGGISPGGSRAGIYTYALVSGLDTGGFEFGILPRTAANEPASAAELTGDIELEQRLVFQSNCPELLNAVLTDPVRADLLRWANDHGANRIDNVRCYEDQLIYSISGQIMYIDEYEALLESAVLMRDAVRTAIADWEGGEAKDR